MFKIGDFSKLGQVSTRMLRHYDKLGLLVPSTIDKWTGYRYYTIQQLPRLHRILALKDLGLSLQEIANLLGDNDEAQLPAEQLRGMLKIKQQELAREKAEMERRLSQVEARLNLIELQDDPSPYEVYVKSIDSMAVASLRQFVPDLQNMGFYCETMTRSLYRQLKTVDIDWCPPELILYHADEYRETDVDIEVSIGVPALPDRPVNNSEIVFQQLPGYDRVATLVYEGPFREMGNGVLELLRWIGTQNHVPAGPLREIHQSGPAHPDEPVAEDPVVELQLPIQSIERLGSPS